MNSLQSSVEQFKKLLPNLKKEEREISKLLYQKLALGRPVPMKAIANELQKPIRYIQDHLKQMVNVEYNAASDVTAYRGVTLNHTKHYVFHKSSKVYTWCALDALFLADLLVKPVNIFSNCPTCNRIISFKVTDHHQTSLKDNKIVMSLFIPSKIDYCEDLQNSFCGKVHFFCNEQCGREWINISAETVFFNLVDSIFIAQERNRQFLGNA